MMRPGIATLCTFAVLLPVAIEVPATLDSSATGETRVAAYGSMGRLAMIDRGCEGQVIGTHPRDFEELAGEIEHRFANGLALGVRGGEVRERAEERITIYDYTTYPYSESLAVLKSEWTNRYVNPSIAVETGGVGAGVGFLWAERPFPKAVGPPEDIPISAHVRFGSLDGSFYRMSYMENVPLYAGGGYFETGFGFRPHRRWNSYIGLSHGGPYDGVGLKLGLDHRLYTHLALSGRARLGSSGGEPQSGFGLGLVYTTRPPVETSREFEP
jgi:hypothetical protein